MTEKTTWLAAVAVVVAMLVVVVIGFVLDARDKSGKDDFPMAPLFTEPTIFGDSMVRLEAYRGRVVLLNFWATWCPPCAAEVPDLIRLYQNFGDRLMVIGISLDRGPNAKEVVQEFYRRFEMNYPVIMGTDMMVNRYGGVSSIPTSFIIDREGRIVERIIGYRNYNQLLDAVRRWF